MLDDNPIFSKAAQTLDKGSSFSLKRKMSSEMNFLNWCRLN